MLKLHKETVRKYWKWGTTPNVNITGSPTVNDGVVSGFSSSNYLTLPSNFSHGSYNWEVQFKVTTGNDVSTQGCICEQLFSGSYYYGLTIYIQSGTLRVRCGNGSSNFWDVDSSYSISTNTTYWIKAQFTGTQYILSASTDGENWTTVSTITSSTIASDNYTMYIGRRNYGSTYNVWQGSIDLTKCYIKIDGKDWWHGTLADPATSSDYDYYEDVDVLQAAKEIDRTYWKYIYREWENPTLSANGTMGGTEYACTGNMTTGAAWQAFDNNTSTIAGVYWGTGGRPTLNLILYCPNPVNVTEAKLWWISDPAQSSSCFSSIYCYGSNDNENWVQIGQVPDQCGLASKWTTMDCSSNTEYYHYYKFTSTQSVGASYEDSNYFGEIKYTGTERIPVVQPNPSFVPTRTYYKYSGTYEDTDYVPLMTSTTAPSGTVTNTGSVETGSTYARTYGAWGKNQPYFQQWTSNSNISTTYTPDSNIPSGHYKLNFQLANYGKWSTWLSIKFTLTYSDDTTEDIYTLTSGFPPKRSDDQTVWFDYSHEFITTKPIKSIKFSGTSEVGNAGTGRIISTYIQQAEVEEGTSTDYDYYIDTYNWDYYTDKLKIYALER